MGVGYESESGAGVVAPRLGGWEARSKSRSTKRQVRRQRLSARHWVHLHTQQKLKTEVPHKWQEHGLRDKKCFTVDLFLKLADDNMDIQNPEAQNREVSGF